MEAFRQINKQTQLLLSILVVAALLCVQGVGLHVHNHDHHGHDHDSLATNLHQSIDELDHAANDVVGHMHMNKAHLSLDNSHQDHHGVVAEIDISPDGVLKSFNNLLTIALIFFLITLVIFSPLLSQYYRRIGERHTHQCFYFLSPPSRAPPIY